MRAGPGSLVRCLLEMLQSCDFGTSAVADEMTTSAVVGRGLVKEDGVTMRPAPKEWESRPWQRLPRLDCCRPRLLPLVEVSLRQQGTRGSLSPYIWNVYSHCYCSLEASYPGDTALVVAIQ